MAEAEFRSLREPALAQPKASKPWPTRVIRCGHPFATAVRLEVIDPAEL
jgi:hypothetical protein